MSYVFFEGTFDVDYGDSEDNVYITENSIGLGFNDSKVFKWLKDSALPVCSQTHYGLTEAQLGLGASGGGVNLQISYSEAFGFSPISILLSGGAKA